MPFNYDNNDINLGLNGQPSNKPTLLFIHGAGMDHTVWSEQKTAAIDAGFQVAMLDLPQHGKSSGQAAETIEGMSDDINSVLDLNEFTSVILIGHSMGALIALTTAAGGHPKIKGTCLCGVASRVPVHPDLLELAEKGDLNAAKMIAKWSYGSALKEVDRVTAIEASIKLVHSTRNGGLANDLHACNNFSRTVEFAEKIKTPCLLLLGEEDKMTPTKGVQKLFDVLSEVEQAILPETGHMMMQEDADGFNTILLDFCNAL